MFVSVCCVGTLKCALWKNCIALVECIAGEDRVTLIQILLKNNLWVFSIKLDPWNMNCLIGAKKKCYWSQREIHLSDITHQPFVWELKAWWVSTDGFCFHKDVMKWSIRVVHLSTTPPTVPSLAHRDSSPHQFVQSPCITVPDAASPADCSVEQHTFHHRLNTFSI